MSVLQAFRLGLYGKRYQWIIPGWFHKRWLDKNDTTCRAADVKMAANYALTVIDLKRDISGKATISGMVIRQEAGRVKNYISFSKTNEKSLFLHGLSCSITCSVIISVCHDYPYYYHHVIVFSSLVILTGKFMKGYIQWCK